MTSSPNQHQHDMTDISYKDLVDEFSPKIIDERRNHLLERANDFLQENHIDDAFFVSITLTDFVLLDYFSDISKLKKFAKIKRINKNKITAYTVYWWLKRKPIQIKEKAININEDDIAFINEKFATSLIAKDLFYSFSQKVLSSEIIDDFIKLIYYNLKYRHYTQRSLELAIAAFHAGVFSTQYDGREEQRDEVECT